LTPEIQELIQSLAHTTASLARAEREAPDSMARALTERARAIDAVRVWLAARPGDARSGGEELARQLAQELETGRQILLRLTLAREVTRSERMSLDRELQVLNGIRGLGAKPPVALSCRG